MAKRDLALDLFHSFQDEKKGLRRRGSKTSPKTPPSQLPHDPQLLKDVLTQVIVDRDWKGGIAEGFLFSTWDQIVGSDIAQHAEPISLIDGLLTIQTSSTAWAVQLQLVAQDLLSTIQTSAPEVLIDAITVIGPNAPSWKKGIRSIKGAKGPRDTYG